MKSAPAIAFDYRPSRLIGVATTCMMALAIAAALLNGLDLPWRLLLALLASALGAIVLYRHFQLRFVRIARGAGGWTLVDVQGHDRPANLLAHVHRGGLLVLEFGDESLPRTRFMLTPDNCNADLRRRLVLVLAAGEPKQQTGLTE